MKKVLSLVFVLTILFPLGGLFSSEGKLKVLEPAEGGVSDEDLNAAVEAKTEWNSQRTGYRANSTVLKCFAAMEYRYTGGRYQDEPIRFRFHTPSKIEEGKRYPLIVWLHGAGESGYDNQNQLSHLQRTAWLLAGKREIPCFILATQCPADNRSWTDSMIGTNKGDAPLTITEEILQTLLKEYPIDPNGVSLYGICSGGVAALDYAERYPGHFAAVATCSASFSGHFSALLPTTVWGFNNQGDGDSGVSLIRLTHELNDHGGAGYVTLHPAPDHDSWTSSMRDGAVAWLTMQNQSIFSPPPNVTCLFRSRWEQFWLFGLPLLLFVGSVVLQGVRRLI